MQCNTKYTQLCTIGPISECCITTLAIIEMRYVSAVNNMQTRRCMCHEKCMIPLFANVSQHSCTTLTAHLCIIIHVRNTVYTSKYIQYPGMQRRRIPLIRNTVLYQYHPPPKSTYHDTWGVNPPIKSHTA